MQDKNGDTALIRATRIGNNECIKLIENYIKDRGEWRHNKHHLFGRKTRGEILTVFMICVIDNDCIFDELPYELLELILTFIAG